MKRLIFALFLIPSITLAAPKTKVNCPFVADVETGEFSKSSNKYKCFSTARAAKNAGYAEPINTEQISFSMSGNTEKNSDPFYLVKGATVTYSCGSDAFFDIDIRSYADGSLVDTVVSKIGPIRGSKRIYKYGYVYLEIVGNCTWSVVVS